MSAARLVQIEHTEFDQIWVDPNQVSSLVDIGDGRVSIVMDNGEIVHTAATIDNVLDALGAGQPQDLPKPLGQG